MANNVLLNSIDHKDVKVVTERSQKYGDNVWYSLTFPAEFRSVQAYYPIFFNKDANTGQFFAVALFGFQDQENLFLTDNSWEAPYLPLSIARQPFLIGLQKTNEDGEDKEQRVLHIDMDHPRVNQEHGKALFLEFGGNTPYLDTVADMLEAIHHGIVDSKIFIDLLIEHELLETFTLDLELNDNSKHQMVGFYTINEEKLSELNTETLAKLHARGYLQAIYMAIASQSNIRGLLNRKNRKLGL
ncbi:SapC family protein [Paraglaciecola sp. MB-3u-78]|uniref:SapC family protein n=1 Tax=Paraglaciecola sp. MB-3u-78 TaxID=2058332 RepID=UPI000C323F8C|nr:SapC family protein [Paraglaciecola sp. MB-3u-78]PKG99275.1 multidrug transporter [Paraglaciecola sp. MB-3u-78]